MRKSSLFGILLAVLAALAVTLPSACEKYVLPELSFSPDTLIFTAAGGTQTLQLRSNVEWEAEINRSDDTWVEWIIFKPTFGDGDCDVEVTLADNTTGPLRSLSFDIKSETLKHTLTIIQEGGSDN
ncbi:MAG: BACON domain-containing protein [Bacteroidales bacterium]|nr:BACON domain-containing protein [Bacteroidales bacterium]